MVELGIFESLQLKRQVLLSATEAAEMIVSLGFNVFSFTENTIVGRSLPAGAEITTFLAPASI